MMFGEETSHTYASSVTKIGGSPKSISRHTENPDQDIDINFSEIINAIYRQKRIAFTVLAVITLSGLSWTLWQRFANPVYLGSFELLVTEPIKSNEEKTASPANSLEDLALNTSERTNTSTLIQVLTSPLLLKPIATKSNISLEKLNESISISSATTGRLVGSSSESGVLEVRLEWRDPKEGRLILNNLSKEYLDFALRQRQEKLTQGLNFLDQQAPELQRKVNEFQQTLADFREKNSYVEPMAQAQTIQIQRTDLFNKLKQLQQEEAKLTETRSELSNSRINNKTKLGLSNQLEQDYMTALKELSENRSNYNENLPQVQESIDKVKRLKEILQSNQLNQINATISENKIQQGEIQRQIDSLTLKFTPNPGQIKKYDLLQQQLDVARENLTSYIRARENFRLQVAQRTVPWKVLKQPEFSPNPIKPSVGKNIQLSLLLLSLKPI